MSGNQTAVSPEDSRGAAAAVVALAASAGGLQALSQVLAALPVDFPAALLIVQHLSPHHPSHMAEILSRRIGLPVKQAVVGDRLYPGHVYIAPPNQHLLVSADGTLALSQSERVQFVRPSANLLFESVAAHFKGRAIAVVLTGTGRDGTSGVKTMKERGGTVIAQDEATSQQFGMPGAAIYSGSVDAILPLDQIAPALVSLLAGEAPG